ncbi:MAG: ankyrin repeat domain-containing protein [Pseudomonadota bacterium]|nr:ankyrin repeat domain-containing protein [Pseudomonadota bacterium]
MPKLLSISGLTILLAGAVLGASGTSSPVREAVKAGDLPALQKAFGQHGDANEALADGTAAIHLAVQSERLDIVQALLAAGANANAKNHYGLTPLALAINHANAPLTEALLKAGADPRVRLPGMGTALMAAAHTGSPAVINALLKAGVNVDELEPTSGQTALMWASAEGHAEAAKTLLDGGADVDIHAAKGQTAMFFAVRKGNIGVVDALITAGADVNERTAAEKVNARSGSQATVQGDSMLVLAINNAHFALADFLLNKGADPNGAGARWAPLHAISRVRNYEEAQYPPPIVRPGDIDSLELAKRLIAHGADPNAKGLTTTARRPGGDQNYKDLIGATPFFLAAKSGDVPYMRLLLAAGANPATPINDHTTPLMVAAGIGCVPGQWIEPERDILGAVKVLVDELKADVNAVNDDHETALHGAVCRGADSVIQYLAEKGAKLDVKDADGQTPLDQALNGLNRAVSMNGPKIIIFHSEEHTIALVKKLTEEQATQTARR